MENKYWGSKFYSSWLNTILLLVLIILMIIALRFMYKNQETYMPLIQDEKQSMVENTGMKVNGSELVKRYENKDIGFSIEYPSKYGEIKTMDEAYVDENHFGYKFIFPGEKGEMFRGVISKASPSFYFTGLSRDYIAGRGLNLGESNSDKCADNSTNITKNGDPYKYELFKEEPPDDFFGVPLAYIAYFKLKTNNWRFPCLSFVFIPENTSITEADFIKM